ncbi:hypothetical protein JCM10207_001571 [Rhodosporidiobolus poonsookiae]
MSPHPAHFETFNNSGMSFVANVRYAVHGMTVGVDWESGVLGKTQRAQVAKWTKEMTAIAEQIAPDVASKPELEEEILGHNSEMVRFQQVLGRDKPINFASELPSPYASLAAFKHYFPTLGALLKAHRQLAIAPLFRNIKDACEQHWGSDKGRQAYKAAVEPIAKEVLDKRASWSPADWAMVEHRLGQLAGGIRQLPKLAIKPNSSWMVNVHAAISAANHDAAGYTGHANTAHSLGQLHRRQQRIYGVSQTSFARQLAAQGMRSF